MQADDSVERAVPGHDGDSEEVPPVPERCIPAPGTVGMAVFDATCLFSKHTRHLLWGFAVYGVVLGRWSRDLLRETAGSLARDLRGDALADFGDWIKVDQEMVRDGLVEGYDPWIDRLSLPDMGDRHVLAAAIVCGATTIVTDNLHDFPPSALAPYGIVAVAPDEFAVACINANPVLATRVVSENPDPQRFLGTLEGQLPNAVGLLRALLG